MKSDMENKDWINDYKALKQVNEANPFTVPAGYFDDLAGRIASLKNITTLTEGLPYSGFTVPENYFDELSANIQSCITIEQTGGDGFTIPERYFEELSSNIQSRIAVEEAMAGREEGFTIPEGYFEESRSNIQSHIAVEEAFTGGGFTVPEGYFEELGSNIRSRINRRGVIRKLFASTAFKYATAACFAVAIGGGILLSQLSNPEDAHKNSFLHKQLSGVPVSDIKSYLMLNVDGGDTQQTVANEGTTVDDADLKNALKNYADSVQ
jgi:hypothetical protein